jgi:hypothetical protein
MFEHRSNSNPLFLGVFSLLCPISAVVFYTLVFAEPQRLFSSAEHGVIYCNFGPVFPALATTVTPIVLGLFFAFKSYRMRRGVRGIGFWSLLLNTGFLLLITIGSLLG